MLHALLLAATLQAADAPAWQPYRLRGTPFSVSLPPGAEARRDGPPRSVEEGRYTLREVYGEKPDRDGIVIPLANGFMSATYYRKPAVYGSIADYQKAHRKSKPWGRSSRGTWEGLATLTAGWESKALDGTPTVTVHFVVEERRWSVLILELQVDAARLDEATPYFVRFKESLKRAG